mmetsp:Transcript_3820/g.5236  ORF Transcript_3820/g.5236 Transcript_3820/m.5236 type:complete len:270 (-) Transcript_3820:1181-1990(-)|eukprot:CAMPEP_0170063550 /NCGR_PEP_ID=MMETSP0019_2-20121128/4379_1 /TAXON_ID=98059 /ORGANISM="Dinobryon sp., Strain UTEXLB2267" /LENGTH=269 /DNA_ID=CAMNT_0010270015 /DNA_START=256 /DNA_END=1065 /DNA_ORIENTATION=-
MNENRGSHGVVGIGNCLYAIGGGGLHSNLSNNERLRCSYDSCDRWEPIKSMPTARHALVVVSYEQFIFAIGGWIDGSYCSPDVEKYDTLTDEWTVCAKMNVARRLLAAAALNNRIYVFGGTIDYEGHYSNALEIYNLELDSWSRGKDLPIAGQCSAATVGSFVYVFIQGHYLVRYCPQSDSYTQLTESLPLHRWFCFDVSVAGSSIFLQGGSSDGHWQNALFQYSVPSNSWTQLPSMAKERRRCASAVVTIPITTAPVTKKRGQELLET